MSKTTQVCATIPIELQEEIISISVKDERTFSQTICMLLKKSIKERNRKRNKING